MLDYISEQKRLIEHVCALGSLPEELLERARGNSMILFGNGDLVLKRSETNMLEATKEYRARHPSLMVY